METLSSVATVVRIAQDIAGAVATVSRNRSRCRKLAKRVQGLGDLMRELHRSEAAGTGTTDAATRQLLGRLEDELRRALQLVRSCRGSRFLRSLLAGWCQADRFDEVDGEIDRCLLDLGVANRILIARPERLLLHHNFKDEKDNRSVAEKGGDKQKHCGCASGGETKDTDKTAAGVDAGNVTITGVPMHTVNAGMHELVPPPSYGYGYWPYTQGLGTGGCYHDGAGAPSDAAAYYNHHLPHLDMFSEENPNACAIC